MAKAFGTLKENLFQSDYISRKNAQITYCNSASYCNNITVASSYDQVNSYNLGVYINNLSNCNIIPVSSNNLVVGLYSKLNLNGICTVNVGPPPLQPVTSNSCNSTPVKIIPSSTTPFNYSNTIDPLGEEFGLTPCGVSNYTNYMVFYPPPSPLNIASS